MSYITRKLHHVRKTRSAPITIRLWDVFSCDLWRTMASLYSDERVTASAPSSIYMFQLKSPRDIALYPFLPSRRQYDPSDLVPDRPHNFPTSRAPGANETNKGRETEWRTVCWREDIHSKRHRYMCATCGYT